MKKGEREILNEEKQSLSLFLDSCHMNLSIRVLIPTGSIPSEYIAFYQVETYVIIVFKRVYCGFKA